MCGAESLNARMGVQPREAELGGVREARESLRMLFGVGASALSKWFKATRTGASLVVEVIAPVITALHDLPGSSGYNRCSPTHRGLSTCRNRSVTGTGEPTCGR